MVPLEPEALSPRDGSSAGSSPHKPRNGLGRASAALGFASVVTNIWLIGPFVGVAAVVTGIYALLRVKRGEATRRGLAVVGILLGLLSIGVGALAIYLASEQSQTGCWPMKQHTGCY
jgi:hypothetical protein